MNSTEKGNALEQAVAGIEDAIVKNNPSLAHSSYRIEPKKRIVVGGVTHELDVFVTFDFAPQHGTCFIFECKNWEDTVGKNEVIILSEKVRAIGAQQGFLVARRFSPSATAQAEKDDSRVKLLTLLDNLKGDGSWKWPSMRQIGPENPKHLVRMTSGISGSDFSVAMEKLPAEVKEQITKLTQAAFHADVELAKSESIEGRQLRKIVSELPITPFLIQNKPIKAVSVETNYIFVNIEIPIEVIARFDIPGYGKHLSFNFNHPDGRKLQMQISGAESSEQKTPQSPSS